ncbi:RNA-binding S4 domain-containing protein [Castellaniella daejeonensis]|jgi:ribosome-associated heat shock protein Hsp15|uniref:RNA-binding S4 domain-containing protein n=1 Tax=Castellaniella daejeonensis TaxID=659013 RepID=A0ABN0TI41_9BURK
MDRMRLDKWLWAARFFKTRSLAVHEIGAGRVLVGGQPAKPAREIAVGDLIEVRRAGSPPVQVAVRALSLVRGPAPQAALLYEETPDSVAARERATEMRRLAPEPARDFEEGRPTKRDRRQMDRWRGR